MFHQQVSYKFIELKQQRLICHTYYYMAINCQDSLLHVILTLRIWLMEEPWPLVLLSSGTSHVITIEAKRSLRNLTLTNSVLQHEINVITSKPNYR